MILSTISAVKMQVNTFIKTDIDVVAIHKHDMFFEKRKRTFYSPLTTLPTYNILLKFVDIGWCSMAINIVFSTIQMVIDKSANGSVTIALTTFLNFIHLGQHSQMRNVSAKVYQHGGHFFRDSSSSEKQTIKWYSKPLFSLQHLNLDCHADLPSIVLVMTLAILWALCLASGPSRTSKNCEWVPPSASLWSVSVVSAWRGNNCYKCNLIDCAIIRDVEKIIPHLPNL